MNNINKGVITLSYSVEDVYQKAVNRSLYYIKFRQNSTEYTPALALSSDEQELGYEMVYEAADYLFEIFAEVSPPGDCAYLYQQYETISIALATEFDGVSKEVDVNYIEIIDSLCEKYLLNHVMMRWVEYANIQEKHTMLQQQNANLMEAMARIVTRFLFFKPTKSYTISQSEF